MRREQKRNFPKWLTLVGVFGVGILFNYAEYGSINHLQKIKDCGFNVVQSYNLSTSLTDMSLINMTFSEKRELVEM